MDLVDKVAALQKSAQRAKAFVQQAVSLRIACKLEDWDQRDKLLAIWGLGGSSKQNPWVFNERGKLMLSDGINREGNGGVKALGAPYPGIIEGPPSSILQVGYPGGAGRAAAALALRYGDVGPGPTRTKSSVRRARDNANTLILHRDMGTPPRIPSVPPPAPDLRVAFRGWRQDRQVGLTREDLWLDEERPPVLATPKPHHVCGLCRDVKSHPVSSEVYSQTMSCARYQLRMPWPLDIHGMITEGLEIAGGNCLEKFDDISLVAAFNSVAILAAMSAKEAFFGQIDEMTVLMRCRGLSLSQATSICSNSRIAPLLLGSSLSPFLTALVLFFVMPQNSHKRKTTQPTLVVAGTAAGVSSRSADDRRQRNRLGVVADDAAPVAGPSHSQFWEEDLATNFARHAELFSYALGNNSLESQPEEQFNDGIDVVLAHAERNPKWVGLIARQDRPMQTWYPFTDEYVNENLRHEGRGSQKTYARDPGVACPHRECHAAPEWHCVDQGCLGEVMQCAECIVLAHANLPTHFVERWDGRCFVRKRNGLQRLGLRVQLNHPPGVVCPYKQAAPHDFVLYDLTGVHELNIDFCGCRTEGGTGPKLENRIQLLRACWWPATVLAPNTCATFQLLQLFQILNCLGKVSAYDFLRGLEKCTNNDGLDKPPDRRKPFMHIVRQYREVKRLKRRKRVTRRATKQGELALMCRACPQPGWNLPDDWEKIDPLYRFLYFLYLAQDANFRLSNRNVSSEEADPILGDGFGYFCKREGDDGYKAHIAKHVDQKEISTCSGFQAMFLADAKRVKGLRTTGIGGVTCSRHNMWQANGMGDLQLLWLVVSYDIACQYAINFWTRMSKMPETMHLTLPPENVWWKVPNFHLPPHKPKCHSPYSFHWMWGAGMTHGEGVEQNWAFSNGAAASTRLMGPGSRHATLEDIFGFHNYDRLLAMHRVLPKRLAVNIKEGLKHRVAFDAFTKGLEEFQPAEVARWKEWVQKWESVQHTDAKDCPFELEEDEHATTLRQIQLLIVTEEFLCTEDGVEIEREHTPGTFITMGLEIEEIQRKLEVDVRALKDPSANQRLWFTKRRTALLKTIHRFRQVQRVYMPSIHGVLSDIQKQMFDGNGEQLPEATRLFMPSEIPDARARRNVCALGLAEIEVRMRHGEAAEVLEGDPPLEIALSIRARRATGPQRARDWEDKLKVLNDDDVRALNERVLTTEEKAQNEHWAELGSAIIEGGIARAAGLARGEGAHTLSWIWYTAAHGADDEPNEDDPQLHEALRVEWCKAFSRTSRYNEEVQLLREEMKCTIAFGCTEALEWARLEAGAEELPDATPELTEGRRAYAAEQADMERARCEDLEKRWHGIRGNADAYVEGRAELAGDGVVTVELDLGEELDAEEEEGRLEAEEEE
ncbi:hypothetical protein B0H13DRAFT_1909206 [Mycena leptocephala]|nr:hypothetical protein B0H13DRAFT_1909206 [Mycena leptocephala]